MMNPYYLKLLTDPTRTQPFDIRTDSYSINLVLGHSLMMTVVKLEDERLRDIHTQMFRYAEI